MACPSCDVTLFLPGLLAPQPLLEQIPATERPDLKPLVSLLSRADATAWGTGAPDADLFRLFGIEAATPPVAALTARAEGFDTDTGWWLRADPVCLVPDRDELVMVDADPALGPEESEQLRETLNAHFAADGWSIAAHSPNRWFIRLAEPAAIATTAPAEVEGQGIRPHLPRGEDAAVWRRALNEAQMLLHDHPVNRRREEEGREAVNSVWFYGGGSLPPRDAAAWDHVHGEAELLRALADYHGIACTPPPSDMGTLAAGRVLIISDACVIAARRGDPFAWLQTVAWVQSRWLAPLTRQDTRLTLLPGDGRAFTVDPTRHGGLRRLWSRRRPLEHWLGR